MYPCQHCQKQPATVHLTEIIDGKKREVHLCEACAQKENVHPFTAQSFFSHLLEPAKAGVGPGADVRCPKCGLSYSEFRQRGRLGCAEDYQLFKEGLNQLLERIHGGTQHLGRVPSRAGANLKRERELIELRRELNKAVQREEYERAAGIRDRIRRIEEQEVGGGRE